MEEMNFDKFCKDFNIVDNALQMRDLRRWNGRSLNREENLSEHTHLVVASLMKIIDDLEKLGMDVKEFDIRKLVKAALTHDSLEVYRGDILSTTKDAIPGLRDWVDKEEQMFSNKIKLELTKDEEVLVKLADLMACYKFVECELLHPSNDFTKQVYIRTKGKFDEYWTEYLESHGLPAKEVPPQPSTRLIKGYVRDAGTDILLTEHCVFLPLSTTTINLKLTTEVMEGEMALLMSRTSAASQGLIVSSCPIDTDFSGEITAIVHNVSNNIIEYNVGEAFCQIIKVPIHFIQSPFKKEGRRTNGKLGSTGGTNAGIR